MPGTVTAKQSRTPSSSSAENADAVGMLLRALKTGPQRLYARIPHCGTSFLTDQVSPCATASCDGSHCFQVQQQQEGCHVQFEGE